MVFMLAVRTCCLNVEHFRLKEISLDAGQVTCSESW